MSPSLSRHPSSAGKWTRSSALTAGLNAKTVMANDHTAFRVDWMPFGGLRESGLGIGGIPHTMADMQVEKSLIIKSDYL